MDYEIASNLKALPAIAPASYTTDQTSSALNTASYLYKSLTLAIYVGVGGITFDADNRVDFELTHSDDDSTYVAATDDDVVIPYPQVVGTGGVVKSFIAAHAAAEWLVVGYRGKKQYVKVKANFVGTHGAGTILGVMWMLGHPMSAPAWNASVPDMV
jgi:hypothetical protein